MRRGRTRPQGKWARRKLTAVSCELKRGGQGEQISILRVINPQQQSDAAVLAGQMREFCYQVSRVSKLCGRDTPVLFTSYLAIANAHQPDELWFEWLAGQAESSVGIGRSAPRALADWLAANRSDEGDTLRAERFRCAVTVKSWREWMAEFVLPHCQRQGLKALQAGRDSVLRAQAAGSELFIGGEMGIGNTALKG